MPIRHIVQQGETTISLAEMYGLFVDTIWNDPANAELKRQRSDMNVLLPGDVLVIPDLRVKEASQAAGKRHRFRRKGVPAKLRLQLFDGSEPRANQDYVLEIDGKVTKGKTDGKGVIEEWISPQASEGTLVVGRDNFEIKLAFGNMDPIEEIIGIQRRLANLGIFHGEATGELDDPTRAALVDFQVRYGLTADGELSSATRDKLKTIHDRQSSPIPSPSPTA